MKNTNIHSRVLWTASSLLLSSWQVCQATKNATSTCQHGRASLTELKLVRSTLPQKQRALSRPAVARMSGMRDARNDSGLHHASRGSTTSYFCRGHDRFRRNAASSQHEAHGTNTQNDSFSFAVHNLMSNASYMILSVGLHFIYIHCELYDRRAFHVSETYTVQALKFERMIVQQRGHCVR